MFDATTIDWISYGIAALFAVGGGFMNLLPPQKFIDGYKRWGYPSWWHYVTAALMFTGSALLVSRETRTFGALLLAANTLAAIFTLIRHREFKATVAPGVLLLLALIPLGLGLR
jgi:uncharacterized membrane protein YphA (DoxX/SURF4 family)